MNVKQQIRPERGASRRGWKRQPVVSLVLALGVGYSDFGGPASLRRKRLSFRHRRSTSDQRVFRRP
jgi:hypothetical protein